METLELQTPATPERRAPVSKKRQRRAQCCLFKLTLPQDEYPELARHVQTAVDAILYQRDRTREETARRSCRCSGTGTPRGS